MRTTVVIPAPDRGTDLQIRVSTPATGDSPPVIVFSHGFGESKDGYDPLVDHWVANGFAVLQPTHLDSRSVNLAPDDPRTPDIWRIRAADLTRVLDELPRLGRFDLDRVAVAGHSWGAQTAGMLLGARVVGLDEDWTDPRITTGVLLAATGTGEELVPFAAEHFGFMRPDFAGLKTPTLIVAGDADQSQLSTRGPDWFTDVYHLAPGATHLLTLFGGEHSLGGITGYNATETTDENPARVAQIQRVTTAYLQGTDLAIDGSTGKLESK
ncbi:alpha/beta hydrolase family protein [Cryptosporangium sp. NPDC048952]|uniref:alpha/beta hydrolase family protein n=1 Tax=Cryptosporangium sp. NPDC048952 TaxID=3363961 RepID=UPI003710838F